MELERHSSDMEASREDNSKDRRSVRGSVDMSQVPDGGLHAWLVVIASFLTNGIIFGIHNCYGIIYLRLKTELELSGVSDAATKASLVGSLSIGMTFFVSPLAGILSDSIGLRRTAVLGGALAMVGMLASSFALAHVEAMYFTYGILFGAGTSLAYNPSLVILGHYFQKRLGLVNGLVTAGSSVFTISLPFFLEAVLGLGLESTMQILAGIMGVLMLSALTFVPRLPQPANFDIDKEDEQSFTCSNFMKKYINLTIWKNKKYVIWAIAVPISMLGYFVPYVHLFSYVKEKLPGADGKVLVLCIGVTSGVGRLLFGKIGDLPGVNRVILQQTAFFSIGVVTMLLTLANSFAWFIVLCLFMGLFDGCFVALVGPMAFDFCGPKNAPQAIGFLLGLQSLPMTTGPTVAGALYGALRSYQLPFLLAGCPPIICALIMLLIHRVKPPSASSIESIEIEKSVRRKLSQVSDAGSPSRSVQSGPYGFKTIFAPSYEGELVVGYCSGVDVAKQPKASNRKLSSRLNATLSQWQSHGRPHVPNSNGCSDSGTSPIALTNYNNYTSAILW